MSSRMDTVGIVSIGCSIPHNTISAEEISERAGLPENVLAEKVGMRRKPVADLHQQPSTMALDAAKIALAKAQIEPEEIGLIIFCGSAPQDYLLWSASAKLQYSLEARNAFAFEVTNGCNGATLGMQIAKSMLLATSSLQSALIVSADKYSPFIDFTDKNAVSLFHVADAAGAVVLKKNEPSNRIVSYFQITDGSYSDYVRIKGGGTMFPYTSEEGTTYERQRFSVENPAELSKLLSEVYFRNYIAAIRTALRQIDLTPADIDFLFTNQVKASTMAAILESLQIPESKSFRSIENYGHMGTVDTLFALSSILESRRISRGDIVVLASSAIGFSWAALVLEY